MVSLHDHHVRTPSVDAAAKRLRLITGFPQQRGPQEAEAIFDGVEAYLMEGDVLGTILFEVEEVEPLALYDKHEKKLRNCYRSGGGHAPWVESRESAVLFIRDKAIRGFDITSSIGGTVWARSLTVRWLENISNL